MNSLAVINGSVWDGVQAEPLDEAVILIENGSIERVGLGKDTTLPPETPTFDAAGLIILPGLMDLHVHLCLGLKDTEVWNALLDRSIGELTLSAAARAVRTLEMGFTTLRDVGDVAGVGSAVKSGVESGTVNGSRVVVGGKYLATTGGHGDYQPTWLSRNDTRSNIVDGPDELIRMIREQEKNGNEWIKFVASGTRNDPTTGVQFTEDEMQTLVKEAHHRGCRVAAHCMNAESALAAVSCGVDTIEHGMDLTDETVELMIERGTWLVPTLSVTHMAVHKGREAGLPEYKLAVFPILYEKHLKSFQKALAAGVRIALGTDAGYSPMPHGANALELELMTANGMSPLQALKTGTSEAALALGRDDLGVIAPGRKADLIAVRGNPFKDVTLLQDQNNISLVIKDGAIRVDRTGV